MASHNNPSTVWDGDIVPSDKGPRVATRTGPTVYYADTAVHTHLKTHLSGSLPAAANAAPTNPRIRSFNPESIHVAKTWTRPTTGITHSIAISRWEGTVVEVGDSSFIADLIRTDEEQNDILKLDIDFDDISEDDQPLIAEGATFYFTVARDTYANRTVKVAETIVFRRLPQWRNFDIEAGDEFADSFFTGLPEQP